MIRKLTEQDITAIIGTTVKGYVVEKAHIKMGSFTDSDHYGILLGKDSSGYVTWQFHYDDGELSVYWGHYISDLNAAIKDYNTRDIEILPEDAKKEATWELYVHYLHEWADSHSASEFYGMSPACFDEWFNNEYREGR
jgi:hypothetical protein